MMFSFVPDSIRRYCSIRIRCFQIKSVIFLLCLNICLKFSSTAAGPTSQQQQELLLLEALSKRQPSYYGTSNSIMDILGRSMYRFVCVCVCVLAICVWKFRKAVNCIILNACARCSVHMSVMRAHHAIQMCIQNATKIVSVCCHCRRLRLDYIKCSDENEFESRKTQKKRNWNSKLIIC